MSKAKEDAKEDKEVEKPIVAKTIVDVQRLKLMKLMKNPDKPVVLPERPKSKTTPTVPEFVRNVMGSSAGAGSGEFHVYRHLRRKEYARQKFIQEKSKKELLDEEYQKKIEDNKQKAEQLTAKKRAKRLKKKARQRQNKKFKPQNQKDSADEEKDTSSEEDSDNDSKISEMTKPASSKTSESSTNDDQPEKPEASEEPIDHEDPQKPLTDPQHQAKATEDPKNSETPD